MRRPSPARPLLTNFLAGPTARIRLCKSIKNIALVISVTNLEIEEAIRDAWTIQQAGPDVPSSARRLAAALLALTLGTPAQPHWVTPDDLWRDRLAVLAEHGAWLLDWVRDRASRIVASPLPCCLKPGPSARAPTPCGARRPGPAVR
jgi:hypothetical protein